VELENLLVFLFSPTVFLDIRIQMVVPTFTTLLTDATFQIMSNLRPVLSTVNFHLVHEVAVFLLCPWPLDHLRVENLLPAVQTLDICAELKSFSNTLPVLGAHLFD
jgi:hypothetical protein